MTSTLIKLLTVTVMHCLDILKKDLHRAADVIASRTSVVPCRSYPHPKRRDHYRIEFELRVNMMIVKAALNRANIQTL